MAAVTVSRSEDRLIAVKQVPVERAAEIEREADLLQRLDHPGLVRFIEIVETADGGRALHTEFVNSDTWATRPLSDPAERAAGMAALAAVVADLHQLGVAHLQLTPPHVLHGADDRPVLCGLTLAAEATPENRQADLAALGELCHDSSLGRGALAGKLSSLADASRAGMLSARELARRLDLLAAKRPLGSDPVRVVGGSRLASLRRWLRPKSLITAGAFAAAIVAAYALGSRSGAPAPPPESPAAVSSEDLTEALDAGPSLVAEPNPNGGTPLAGEPELTGETGPVGEPGLIEAADTAVAMHEAAAVLEQEAAAVTIQEAAAVLEHGGRRYAVGAIGDFVETGDWDCDGRVTAAIVRPSTGGVVLFDAWPEPGRTIALPVRWSVDSPTGAEAVAHGQCDLLRVYTSTGSRLFNPAEAS
ncbi:MAG: hypothetical protein F4Z34_03500 [Acidimicrobiaceae bacterium]|nr:hypothetical protein [Acidimicrobiaceae bacterium]MYE66011.1 hypothetical protein [Acidimicrobiaceae bacterium]